MRYKKYFISIDQVKLFQIDDHILETVKHLQ